MSANFRSRLAKLEHRLPAGKDIKLMSDDEICEEINIFLERARQCVWWHANHPEGFNGPVINALSIEEVTIEMIVLSEHVEEGDRRVAQLMIDAGTRRESARIMNSADSAPISATAGRKMPAHNRGQQHGI